MRFRLTARTASDANVFLPNEAAYGKFNDSYSSTGWSVLEVHSNPAMDDVITAAAAGVYEGYVTAHRIDQTAVNEGAFSFNVSSKLQAFLDSNAQYMKAMVQVSASLPADAIDRKIFYHVNLINKQLEGVHQGYLAARAQVSAGAYD